MQSDFFIDSDYEFQKNIKEMSVHSLPTVEEPSIGDSMEAKGNSAIHRSIIKVKRKSSLTDNWPMGDTKDFSVWKNDTKLQKTDGKKISILKAPKDKSPKAYGKGKKSKRKRLSFLIVTTFLSLKFLLVICCSYGPIFGLSPRATFWIIIGSSIIIGMAFCLPKKIKTVIKLAHKSQQEETRKGTRVSFSRMAEVSYI